MSLLARSSLLCLAGLRTASSSLAVGPSSCLPSSVLGGSAISSPFLGLRRGIHTQPLPPYRLEQGVPGFLSPRSLNTHFHHIAWPAYQKLNKLTSENSIHYGLSPEIILQLTSEDRERAVTFNAASNAWNHTFFWNCIHVCGARDPRSEITTELEAHLRIHFGSSENMMCKFTAAAMDMVGSGWVWVVAANGQLHIIATPNCGTPVAFGPSVLPILALDMFEHSYVMDYGATKEGKLSYINNFWTVVNWNFVEENVAFSQLDEKNYDAPTGDFFDDLGSYWQRFRGD